MALIYSILLKTEYISLNAKIDEIYAGIQNACFSRKIYILFVAATIALW